MVNHLARSLRNNATNAERRLWQELRLLKNEGRHFRRQVAIGPYIADFACHGCKLVVELDGGQHNDEIAINRDRQRTEELGRHGYRVVRFWNVDVFANLEGVVDMIRHEARLATLYSYENGMISSTPAPGPSPQGGGE